MATAPVIDISSVNISKPLSQVDKDSLISVGEKIVSALTQIGFVHVSNHGVPENIISAVKTVSSAFFDSPIDKKMQCLRKYPSIEGYIPLVGGKTDENFKEEVFDSNKPPDVRETLHYAEWFEEENTPHSLFPTFRASLDELMKYEHELHRRIMALIGFGLHLDDPLLFLNGLQHLGTASNETVIRLANYPPIAELKENQERCGVHTDFGTLTFIFQSSVPGLQIMSRTGEFVSVIPHEDAVLVNIGDLLQRWTGNVLRSAPHKVVVDEESREHGRTSIIYFGITDVDFDVSAIMGDQNEESLKPMNSQTFLRMRYEDIFQKGKGLRD